MCSYGPLQEVIYWDRHYAGAGIPDMKAAQVFLDVEPDEKVRPLKLQLQAIAEGKFEDEVLDQFIGKARKARHGSYERWAKLMLMWIHVPKH